MLKDSVLEQFYSNKTICDMSVNAAAETINVIQEVLEKYRKENPYATLPELFDE